MLNSYTYTHAYARAQAVVDQVSVLFREAGVDSSSADKVCHGVDEKWLEAVGLYLKRNGHRVYEVEVRINWSTHSDVAELDFSTDLPGWEGSGSPEAVILGTRFAVEAGREGLTPHYWVRFTSTIRSDPARHQRLCSEVGVIYGGNVPSWAATPTTRSLSLQDLREIGLSERSTL